MEGREKDVYRGRKEDVDRGRRDVANGKVVWILSHKKEGCDLVSAHYSCFCHRKGAYKIKDKMANILMEYCRICNH